MKDPLAGRIRNTPMTVFSEPHTAMPLEKRFDKFKAGLKSEARRGGHFAILEESSTHIKARFHRCPYHEVYSDYRG